MGLMSNPDNFSERVRTCAQRIAESGAPALAGLYDLAAQRLVRFAVTVTRNQHDAEDAVQAALVRVAGDCDMLRRAAAPWPYLLRMVRNEALVILRRKRRWRLLDNISDLLSGRAVDQVEQADTHRAMWLALRRLPNEQSEVVVLKIWEELTFAQIAEVLGIPAATAASRYRYALAKLSSELCGHQAEVHRE
jgi:RNA polymerase sigma-70 factor (ECF subfamily)